MSQDPYQQPSGRWRLDRTIPLPLIVTIIIQTGFFVWWASGIDHRVRTNESWIAANSQITAKLATLEERTANILNELARLGRFQDRDERT